MRVTTRKFYLSLTKVNKMFATLAGVATLTIMAIGSIDILATNLLSKPVPAAFEIIETLLVIVVFFSISLAQTHKVHIRVELLYNLMSKELTLISDLIAFFLSAAMYGLIAYYGFEAGVRSYVRGEFAPGIISFPIWPTRFALFVGASLMTIQCLTDFLMLLLGYDDPMQKSEESQPRI